MSRTGSASVLQYLRGVVRAGPVAELSDAALVQRFAQERDEAAFACLVRRHGALVLGVCRRLLGHEQEAEDVFQAVFLVLSKKAGALRDQEAVGPWLLGVAHRLALKARQQSRERREREGRVDRRPAGNFLDELTVREAQLVLDEELMRLPERERGPLVLCYLQGLTRDEAAQRLGCPLGTLKSRLERARRTLHERLRRRGVALGAVFATLLLDRTSTFAMATDLVTRTVNAGLAFAVDSATGEIGPKAAALAHGMLQAALVNKIKIAAACLVMAAACVGSALWFGSRPPVEGQADRADAQGDRRMKLDVQPQTPARHETDPASAVPPVVVQVSSEGKRTADSRRERTAHRFLDLQPHANQKLKEGFGRAGNDLAGLPTGEQVLAGIKFRIGEGLIQLRGRGTPHPMNVEGIEVGGTFSKLYFLQATQWDAEKDLAGHLNPLCGYYTVFYEDKSQATISIVFGRDTGNWWYTPGCSQVPSHAVLAWEGANEDARKVSNSTIRLYVSRWDNPEPGRKVASIRFSSTNSMAAPFCVAMTIEE